MQFKYMLQMQQIKALHRRGSYVGVGLAGLLPLL